MRLPCGLVGCQQVPGLGLKAFFFWQGIGNLSPFLGGLHGAREKLSYTTSDGKFRSTSGSATASHYGLGHLTYLGASIKKQGLPIS